MLGFIVVSVDKKTLKKVKEIDSTCIKYTSVLGMSAEGAKMKFNEEFPEKQLILVMPLNPLKKQVESLDKLLMNHKS